ncbi:N-acetyldiaminopimelate deacetylase [Apilactobacillus micheneri]|uniref:N-acetyldiaminopimelate deacetylase n=1 Tax=Apilactobacillus micheneri TaxID=1899430 RepID=A0A9Q8IMY5_9LACO|nr:N-acetyldiaminopimelate deacetylase [Apilactobacillus micheneri]TPR40998.1 N-acetyldiaminopimelate deacetylase [Apilactobacillus micheneri]TPR42578.1 N-acetyldiaminopimelate deacetylase [Apilactobacillus micheneri]TPR45546.1 N-acetyldiaminopimelate deacetylase [Apilactobacillus micheneri]TPR46105.1 N-acetyldiaminopimelate deacetylase [Apilactobacillus micheneri]TPR46790.1 N-acetyldiaminopimelate deacetylase [Apilactobacillus micheneri]
MAEINLIDIRRHLHQIPELALHENQTHDYLLHIIGSFNQENVTMGGIESLPTAILVRIQGSNPKRTIGYRTDIDALPIEEKTNLPFSSTHPGIMHACGHDVHMTVALGILHYFTEHQPKDNLVFFFQPAEESESGGRLSYEANAFSGPFKIDEFYGLHDNPSLPAGSIGCRMGTLFAGTTEINIDLTGKGGHAAYPQNANDMVVAAAQLINQVQTIISRSIDPIQSGVITLGKIEAGTIRNVIAGHARIEGTIRGLTQSMIELIDQRLKDICHGIELSYNCKVDLELNQGGYYPVENNSALTKGFIHFMKNNSDVDFIETKPAMTGEDFGYLLSKIPGTMFWLGVGDDSSLHTATLTPDESAIDKGVNAIISFLENRMKE